MKKISLIGEERGIHITMGGVSKGALKEIGEAIYSEGDRTFLS